MMWWVASVALGGQGPQVLLIGNSYTSRNDLATTLQLGLREHRAWPGATVRALAEPGASLADHARRATDGDSGWEQALGTTWDVVVLQDQSQIPGFPEEHEARIASVEALTSLLENLEADRVVLFQTWGRRDGDPDNPERFPSFSVMQDELTAGYAAYAEVAGTTEVARVGEAFRAVHTEDLALFERLYATDGSHPSPMGSFVAAATIFGIVTGSDPGSVPAPWQDPDPNEVSELLDAVRSVLPTPAPDDEPEVAGCSGAGCASSGAGHPWLAMGAWLALLVGRGRAT